MFECGACGIFCVCKTLFVLIFDCVCARMCVCVILMLHGLCMYWSLCTGIFCAMGTVLLLCLCRYVTIPGTVCLLCVYCFYTVCVLLLYCVCTAFVLCVYFF